MRRTPQQHACLAAELPATPTLGLATLKQWLKRDDRYNFGLSRQRGSHSLASRSSYTLRVLAFPYRGQEPVAGVYGPVGEGSLIQDVIGRSHQPAEPTLLESPEDSQSLLIRQLLDVSSRRRAAHTKKLLSPVRQFFNARHDKSPSASPYVNRLPLGQGAVNRAAA